MAVRITQEVIEVVAQPTTALVRVTQEVVEAVITVPPIYGVYTEAGRLSTALYGMAADEPEPQSITDAGGIDSTALVTATEDAAWNDATGTWDTSGTWDAPEGLIVAHSVGGPASQDITDAAIASGLAFGTAVVAAHATQNIAPDVFFPGSAQFGSVAVALGIAPPSIAATAIGTPAVHLNVAPDAAEPTVAFGSAVVAGPITVEPGLASTLAFGAATLTTSLVLWPSSIEPQDADSDPRVRTGKGRPSAPALNAIQIDPDLAIASTADVGAPVLTSPLGFSGVTIAPATSFGDALLFDGTAGNATGRPFTVWIRGIEVSRFVKAPSVEITAQNGSRATARFTVIPYYDFNDQETFTPNLWDEVIVHHRDSGRLYAGYVETTERRDFAGPRGHYEIGVTCSDYGMICDRRLMARYYDAFHGSNTAIIAQDIITNFLDGTGITFATGAGQGAGVVGLMLFNWRTVTEAFNEACNAALMEWRVDFHKQLWMFDRGTGYIEAPYEITDVAEDYWLSIHTTRSKSNFYNAVRVRPSNNFPALQTDTSEAVAASIIWTEYATADRPIISVNGVQVDEELIVEMDARAATPDWQWYYIKDGQGVFPRSPVTGTVVVEYDSLVSWTAYAEDADSIAAHGKTEILYEIREAVDLDAVQGIAESLLGAGTEEAVEISLETMRPGLEPGMRLRVNTTRPALDDTFLIEQVTCRELAQGILKWVVKASNAPSRRGIGSTFFQRLIATKRQAKPPEDSNIGFTLAETIEGFDNPGLTVGVKQAYRTALTGGFLKKATLGFRTIEGAPGTDPDSGDPITSPLPTGDIKVDVLRNGASIFADGKPLKLHITASGDTSISNASISRRQFVDALYRIHTGDVFSVEILEVADGLIAKDGWIELQVVG